MKVALVDDDQRFLTLQQEYVEQMCIRDSYSAEDYETLMDRFREEGVPLSVAVLDMDWHITDVDPRDGKGWTGYTWNRALIPRPTEFLDSLHDRGLKVTLNLHPAEGVQPHEEQYAAAARALGRDAEKRAPIPFDFCDPAFVRTYFCLLYTSHHGIVSTLLYFLDDGPHQRGVVRVLQRVLILGAAQDDGNDIRSVLREAAGGCIGDISTPLNDLTDALSVLL